MNNNELPAEAFSKAEVDANHAPLQQQSDNERMMRSHEAEREWRIRHLRLDLEDAVARKDADGMRAALNSHPDVVM
jgi:hypothetical protein